MIVIFNMLMSLFERAYLRRLATSATPDARTPSL